MKIDFYRHELGRDEKKSLNNVLDSNYISSGPILKKFEKLFSKYLNIKFCLGVSSWTMGNLILLKALGIKKGDEVITTPLTFPATVNTVLLASAKPIFADVEIDTGNIDANKIESYITKKTKAILVVHMYGQMCDMKKISKIAKKNNLLLIEDCAHCLEGEREKIRPGKLSDASVFSFYATKNITSGEGGAILTNNSNLYEKLKQLQFHGIKKNLNSKYSKNYKHWDQFYLGYKCNMSDIQASLLIPQIKKIKENNKKRNKIWKVYKNFFNKYKNIKTPKILNNSKHAMHLFTIWVNKKFRDKILVDLIKKNIGVGVHYRSVHLLNYYKNKFKLKEKTYPNSSKIGQSTITLPFYPSLTKKEQYFVLKNISIIFKKYKII